VITNANNAIASVNAKPKIAILNNSSFNDGFLEVPNANSPKTVPISIPAPAIKEKRLLSFSLLCPL